MTNIESDRIPERVTQHPDANEQLLYFTSTMALASSTSIPTGMAIWPSTGHPFFDGIGMNLQKEPSHV